MYILLNSDIDNFIIYSIVGTTALMFVVKWAKNKLESRKPLISSFLENEIEDHLDAYTFNFQNNISDIKMFSFKAKLTSIFLSILLVIVPFYELVETLRPTEFFYWFSCLPYGY